MSSFSHFVNIGRGATTLCCGQRRAEENLAVLHVPTSGHMGRTRTLYWIKERFMWHGLVNDVQNMVRINDYVVDDKFGSRITYMKIDYMLIFHNMIIS